MVIGSPWKAALILRYTSDGSRLSMRKSDRSLLWYRVDGVLTPSFDVLPARGHRSNKDSLHGCCMVSNTFNRIECPSQDVLMPLGVAWNKLKPLRVRKYRLKLLTLVLPFANLLRARVRVFARWNRLRPIWYDNLPRALRAGLGRHSSNLAHQTILNNWAEKSTYQEMTLYLYNMLQPSQRQIRLCTIHPGPFDESLSCSLRTVSLDKEPKYETLSYLWGEPIFDHAISVDGSVMMITKNLHVALRYLREPRTPRGFSDEISGASRGLSIPGTQRVLWADAICIKQADIDEHSSQVRLMGDIYRNGKELQIWLREIKGIRSCGGALGEDGGRHQSHSDHHEVVDSRYLSRKKIQPSRISSSPTVIQQPPNLSFRRLQKTSIRTCLAYLTNYSL